MHGASSMRTVSRRVHRHQNVKDPRRRLRDIGGRPRSSGVRAPPRVPRRKWSRFAIQVFRLAAVQAAYGCGSAPASDRLPLVSRRGVALRSVTSGQRRSPYTAPGGPPAVRACPSSRMARLGGTGVEPAITGEPPEERQGATRHTRGTRLTRTGRVGPSQPWARAAVCRVREHAGHGKRGGTAVPSGDPGDVVLVWRHELM